MQSLLFIHAFKNTTTFEDFFLVNQSLTNAIISFIPSCLNTWFIAVSDISAHPPKKNLNLTPPVQLSIPHPGKGQIPTPGKALQIKFPTPRSQKIVKFLGFARRMLKFPFDQRKNMSDNESENTASHAPVAWPRNATNRSYCHVPVCSLIFPGACFHGLYRKHLRSNGQHLAT